MIKKYNDFLNEDNKNYLSGIKDNIIEFVKNNSYLDFDQEDDGALIFSTRENGDVGEEEPGQQDIAEAKKLRLLILQKFKSLTYNIDVIIEIVDEWVMLTVKNKEEKVDEYKYAFKKSDDTGAGFTEGGFRTMDDLIKRFGDWIEVDWEKIKSDLDKINEFPDNTFMGWHRSRPFLIKKAGEKGNQWGYSFYIIKSKKD
jgi:hypothetical protein